MSRRRLMEAGPDGRPVARWEETPELARTPPVMFEPAYPPGPIERRYITPQPRNGHHHRPTSPAYDTAAHIARSRANGARRHVEVTAARRAQRIQEERPMPDPSALEQLASAARTAHDAYEEKVVAEEAWDIAQRALADAWADVEDLVGNGPGPVEYLPADGTGPWSNGSSLSKWAAEPSDALRDLGEAIIKGKLTRAAAKPRQPGHHPASPSEEREKSERAARVMAAIERHGGDKRKAAAELGMKLNAVVMVAKHAGARLPGSST